jgi:hypothetical protein
MNPWQFSTLILVSCLVSAIVGWSAASLRYMELAGRMASTEAAIATYWDRVRKRMRVEEKPVPIASRELTEQEIMAIARTQGLVVESRE